ncbi:2-succinyl-6-hydroxy-2,4-cyclohexadiene-1-carboxylate synthase [Photobacterium sanctipauli]|uniref:2-succinyl-6-hydroxy-2, 4-cyclohexadiene-1-carboxylate synthase n=1 Tax=Photobacterium sanctipauli TaxID=1342794 RepID=A0A2T3NV41_9GAMM|nr:alpha/beta fold hydrolase [Photobacterium sanctipauli]PSW20134.1 2-succinyl-6-hydroxy-2,4-cyclohexadiene-1-carboxylate synthase [Photobacterium sanctipauli]
MATHNVGTQTMHYLDIGEGPVVVLGHSYLWDSQMWAPQLESLSQSFRCIVPDFWAHGQSDNAPTTTRTLADYASDVLSLLDALNIEQFSLVGLSSGGMWATEVVIKAPSRVQSLVLLDSFVGLEPEVVHTKYFNMMEQADNAKALTPEFIDFFAELQFSQAESEEKQLQLANFKHVLANVDADKAAGIAQAGRMVFGRRDTFEMAEMFALPTLIMVGAQDKVRPVLESQLMHDGITGSEYFIIPNAGHISNLEQPWLVTEKLRDFLSRQLLAN